MDEANKEIFSVGEVIFACIIMAFAVAGMMVNPLTILALPVGTMMFLHGMKGLGYR